MMDCEMFSSPSMSTPFILAQVEAGYPFFAPVLNLQAARFPYVYRNKTIVVVMILIFAHINFLTIVVFEDKLVNTIPTISQIEGVWRDLRSYCSTGIRWRQCCHAESAVEPMSMTISWRSQTRIESCITGKFSCTSYGRCGSAWVSSAPVKAGFFHES